MDIMPVVPVHLGALHANEQALVLALAFGPFVLLGLVVAVRNRRDRGGQAPDPVVEVEPQRDR